MKNKIPCHCYNKKEEKEIHLLILKSQRASEFLDLKARQDLNVQCKHVSVLASYYAPRLLFRHALVFV